MLLVLVGLWLVVLGPACSKGSGVDEAARDRCEERWGVGNCVERTRGWVPLASATSTSVPATSTTVDRPATSSPAAGTSAATVPATTEAPAGVVSLDPANMTYPPGSCGQGTPALPLVDGAAGPGVLQEGPYNGVTVVAVVGQTDLDADGSDELVVQLSCDFGGNALAIVDHVVVLGGTAAAPVLFGGMALAPTADVTSKIRSAAIEGDSIVVNEDVPDLQDPGTVGGAVVRWTWSSGSWRSEVTRS